MTRKWWKTGRQADSFRKAGKIKINHFNTILAVVNVFNYGMGCVESDSKFYADPRVL